MHPPLLELDSAGLRAWASSGLDQLGIAREEIDALNVYPVPDGDTGTNLYLTVESAVRALVELPRDAGPGLVLNAMARGALLGARGNSGVILSQVLRGLADALGDRAADVATMAGALRSAADAAYASVASPVEGTMLTVLRAAAVAAQAGDSLPDVVAAAALGAREALQRTPDQLEILRRAGVVDAGGRGVCVLFDALDGVVAGRPMDTTFAVARTPLRAAPAPPAAAEPVSRAELCDDYDAAGGPSYEVMFLLDAPREAIPVLRERLAAVGDSVVVVGAAPEWNVHVHVDDVGAAVEAGIAAGRPHGIRVTGLREPAPRPSLPDGPAGRPGSHHRRTSAIVSVVAGDGLAALFEAAGATVVRGGPGRRASTAELLAGFHRAGARDIVVLPNDSDSHAVARVAGGKARDEGLRVAVIPTRASVQALAALAVHDPARGLDDDLMHMTAAAVHCRHGGVTVASRPAMTTAGICAEGDVLGIVEGDFVVIGSSLEAVGRDVVDRMLGSGGEMVTLVTGAGAGAGLTESVVQNLRHTRPDVDTVVYSGGQPRYPLLIGVE